jgi:NTE family protein
MPAITNVALRTGHLIGVMLSCALTLACVTAAAADADEIANSVTRAGRPRIGLVLSGGGARGFAHIGVLKVLEELRVPVDCIAGTSMGAVVGGAYAAGIAPDEMEKRIAKLEWDDLLVDDPGRLERPIRRRKDDFTSLWDIELGYRDGAVQLPAGTTSGYKFELFLRDLITISGGVAIANFDELPVPYRAVATNLETGAMRVFEKGDLARVMRASMSVPGAFAPVQIDGELYVDGGLVRNLPVDVARATCADVVIAVNLGTPLGKRDQLKSVFAVALQSVNLMTELNVSQSLTTLKETDVLITPELTGISSADFVAYADAIKKGIEGARTESDRLLALQLPEPEYAVWVATRESRRSAPVPIAEIRVATDTTRVKPEVIKSELTTQPGDDFTSEALESDLKRLYGRGDFDRVDYSLVDEDGKRAVLINASEKSWGPNYIKFGLGLYTDFQEGQRFNLLGSYRRTWLNSLGAEWRTDAQVGFTNRFVTEFYQPLGFKYVGYVAPRIELQSQPVQFFFNNQLAGSYGVKYARAHLDAGYQNRLLDVRLGPFAGQLRANPDFGVIDLPRYDLFQAGLTGRVLVDQLDDTDFPRDGYLGLARVFSTQKAMGSEDQYTKADASLLVAKSLDRHTLNLGLSAGGAVSGDLPVYDPYTLGGFQRLSGLQIDQLTGKQYMLGRLAYYYKYDRLPPQIGTGLYFGASAEVGRMNGRNDPLLTNQYLGSFSVFWGADTIIGPVYLAYGHSTSGYSSFYFLLGRP